jgi:acyl-CoA thioesterase-1
MLRSLLFLLVCLVLLPVQAAEKTLLVLADSLSASYGIAMEQGWVSLLQRRLHEQGYLYRVINASISGDTTHGAKSRLDEILVDGMPEITIVELGGNDGLRGLPIAEIRKNLEGIIIQLQQQGGKVLLLPMLLPPNYGKIYIDRFAGLYRELADVHDVALGRFILVCIADRPELMQGDGIHPRAEAQGMMLDNVWPDLEPLLVKEQDQAP